MDDPETGTDIKLTYTIPGTPGSFPKTALQPRRRPSVLCDDAIADCQELIDSVPDIDNLFEVKTTEEIQELLDGYLSSDNSAESSSSETTKFKKPAGSVDEAFAAFMGEN